MRNLIVVVTSLLFSTPTFGLKTSEFVRIMESERVVPEDVRLHFSGLMGSSLFWNAYRYDAVGERFFCSPQSMTHRVEDHITMTYGYIERAGSLLRQEFKKHGQDFNSLDVSQVHGMALMAWFDCGGE